jgi:hypothetical protein
MFGFGIGYDKYEEMRVCCIIVQGGPSGTLALTIVVTLLLRRVMGLGSIVKVAKSVLCFKRGPIIRSNNFRLRILKQVEGK